MPEFDNAPAPVGGPNRPRPRLTRSRLAKLLLTSVGMATMLVGSTVVIMAVSSTGSMRLSDWTHAAGGSAHKSLQPLYSVATVQDQASAAASSGQGAMAAAPRGSTSSAPPGAAGRERLVKLPVNGSREDVLAVCQAAMKTAQTRGTAAMTEVESECEDDLRPLCPTAIRTPRTQGTAAIRELEDECMAPRPQTSPGRDD